MNTLNTSLTVGALLAVGVGAGVLNTHGVRAQTMSHEHYTGLRADPATCRDATLACASYASPFFDASGRLWLVWSGNGRVAVASSTDVGRTVLKSVTVTPQALRLYGELGFRAGSASLSSEDPSPCCWSKYAFAIPTANARTRSITPTP